MPEPLPVSIVAVNDVVLPAAAGQETELDQFYVDMLEFQRDDELPLAYWGDNFRVVFEIIEGPITHDSYRVLQVQVQLLREAEQKLIDRELTYTRQKGLTPGSESLALLDPAGNWVELIEARRIM
jgi:hypothetical protein